MGTVKTRDKTRPLVHMLYRGVGWKVWCWDTDMTRVSEFETAAEAADDARAFLARHGDYAR